MLPDVRTTLLVLVVGLAAGGLGSWYLTAEYKDSKWEAAVGRQKVEAADLLRAATDRAVKAERQHNELATELEAEHDKNQLALDRALNDNRRLARELGGLRDPGRRPSCGGPVPAAAGDAAEPATAATGAELSAEASEFLLEFARDADRAAEYAGTCHEWARRVGR
jgi:hypothetical protein